MFKSLTVLAVVASAALAQTVIPTGITDKCTTFLNALNTDTTLQKCTGSLSTALSAFAPGAASASSDATTAALKNVCSDSVSTDCPTSAIASQLTGFYAACPEELTSNPNADVIKIYDVLYVLLPMREAVCSKDDSANWCVANAKPLAGTSADTLQSALYTKTGETYVPNTSTFTSNNIPFLFLNADTTDLCSTCTRNVLNAYIKHESNLPYAPGLTKSQLLSTQSALFTAVTDKCGDNFMNSEVKAAGGLSSGSNSILGGSSNGASHKSEFQGAIAAFAGIATLAFTALF